MENYLTTRQVQELFKVDRITIYRMVQDGRLKGVKVGTQWRFSQREVERLLSAEAPAPETDSDSAFPTHCVQTIQNLFTSVSTVSGLVIDNTGKPVTQISEPCQFCQLMQSSPTGRAACLTSWAAFARQAKDKPQRFTCHAGLDYLSAPVIDQGKLQGQFLAGEFYWSPPQAADEQARCQQLAELHNLELNELQAAVRSIHSLSAEQRDHLTAQPAAAARAIESILSERTSFLNRLQQIASLTQNL